MIWASANRKEKVLWTGTNKYLLLSQPGWDKIFYFVGSNTFSQKFRLKQRESDATKGVQNSGKLGFNLQIYYISINASFDFWFLNRIYEVWWIWNTRFYSCKLSWSVYISALVCWYIQSWLKSCLFKSWIEILFRSFINALTKPQKERNFFLWQKISNCGIKFLLFVSRNFFWCQ